MKKIVICVPTYNRPKMVQEVLEYELAYYVNYNFDIIYYDSSENSETYDVIQKARDKKNIAYKKMDSRFCLDYKIIEILKDLRNTDYDYVWLMNDSISITEEALKILIPILEENYDLIRLPLSGSGRKEDFICENVNTWFEDCSQGMAHMASTIMSTSLLKDDNIDWENLRNKYVCNNELNEKHGFFFMVAFYLERILTLNRFKGIMIGNRVKWRRDSPLKANVSYWNDMLFDVWIRSYCETILALPDVYKNKENTIRISDNIQVGRFSSSMLKRYRVDGSYSYSVYKKYKRYFKYVTDLSVTGCFMIAVAPKMIFKILIQKKRCDDIEFDTSINKIQKKIQNKNVIVYGAGLYGERVVKELKTSCNSKIIAIAVTDKSNNIDEIEEIKIRNIQDLITYKNNSIVIIATLPEAAKQIKKNLKKYGFKNYVSIFGY